MLLKGRMLAAMFTGLGAMALVGCSSDDVQNLIENVEDPAIQGRFVSECGSSSLINLSERSALMFQGNEFTRTQSYFSADDCQEEAAKIDYKGTFAVEPDAPADAEGGQLDIRIDEVKITVNNEATATALSAINFCGVQEFPVGEEVVIKGEMSEGLCPLMNVPSERYGTYKVEDNRLYLDGEINEMSESAANRNKSLGTDAYIKD
jgi:hypothetical protein